MLNFLNNFMFGTPDFGHSDLWHLNLSLKFLLSESLKHGYLPLWSKDIGTGFPLLGEGQIGMFNLYNLVAFRYLDLVLAFNLGYLVIFLTAIIGSYFFGRALKLDRLPSLLLGILFSLSGIFVTHLPHYNLIQALSFLPWQFYCIEKYFNSQRKRELTLLAFFVSQQIFSGSQQITLLTLIAIGAYSAYKCVTNKTIKPLAFITISTLVGVTISSPQLLPSYELLQQSFRDAGTQISDKSLFPLAPKHLLTFFNPYFFGNPKIGTYPHFSPDWGIFWESTGYIGIVPLFLIGINLIKIWKNTITRFFLSLSLISIVLALGKYTPLFIAFQLPIINFFRVPARFLIIVVWSLVILASITVNKIKKPVLQFFIVCVCTVDLGFFALNYNAVIDRPAEWVAKPPMAKLISSDPVWFRIYSIIPFEKWNEVLLTKGWQDINKYFQFRNALDANQNLLWGIASVDVDAGIAPRRTAFFLKVPESVEGTRSLGVFMAARLWRCSRMRAGPIW